MAELQFMIFDNMFIIVIAIFILFFLVGQVRKKKVKEQYEANVKEAEREANKFGLNVTKQMPNISAMSYDLSHGVDKDFGDTIYEGENNNLKWKLVSTVKYSDDTAIGPNRRDLVQQTLKWSTNDVKMRNHNYVMFMDAPVEIKTDFNNEAGFLSSIKNFVAEKALDFYVANYFGAEYKELINISDGEIIRNDQLSNCLIITNTKDFAESLLDPEFIDLLKNWDSRTSSFSNQNLMKTPGILFAPDRLIITTQSSVKSAEEASKYSVICGEIADKIKNKYGW